VHVVFGREHLVEGPLEMKKYRGWGIGGKIGWSSGKYRLLVQTNMCFVWVCCEYNKSSLEHYAYAAMYDVVYLPE
jgi:hypothetical protein